MGPVMSGTFFENPILNSPYADPARHWHLDKDGQPTSEIVDSRRKSALITPVPKPKKRTGGQGRLVLDATDGLSDAQQEYNPTPIINEIRTHVAQWRALPNPEQWQVTPETARLLHHWRQHRFQGIRPFFCQIEAVETMIWLTEVAGKSRPRTKQLREHFERANAVANPGLFRLAMKLATGAGKTQCMAMLIAWQTVNAVRHPNSNRFSRGFLIICPGITIRDRLRVLLPNDADSYYRSREIVPADMLPDLARAKIVITNYHAFKRREKLEIARGTQALVEGQCGKPMDTLETEGEMIRRVMPDLMGLKGIVVLNDEAHHCYREKPASREDEDLKGDDRKEADQNNEAARLWISGIEIVQRKLGLCAVFDLSATPFFLRGSGYVEGTLFPWTASDFSLLDAIECGIVKLPRVPVSDNLPAGEMPVFRNLWDHIGRKMPTRGRARAGPLDPLSIPTELQAALDALYGHYEQTFELWQDAGIEVPPVFIVVANNTATSKLIHDYIAGFERIDEHDDSSRLEPGKLPLFRNHDEHGNRLPRPRTLLIDSEQLDSGDALDSSFRDAARDEIERFRREMIERTGNQAAGQSISDQDLLREVMNTVGKVGQLGESIRCVVSVAMLTEGWDASTVTHVLGVRAFGTQLLCEQVVGRALRRQSYDLNEAGHFNVEYADVLGIPFDFTARPVVAKPVPPRETITVQAIRDREALEIRFPRVEGYRVELPNEHLTATFNADSTLRLTPELVGPSITRNQGIIGAGVDLDLHHLADMRRSTIIMHLTRHLLLRTFRDQDDEPKAYLFGQLKRIVRQWLDGGHLDCAGDTCEAQLMYQQIADWACDRITAGITAASIGDRPVKAILDPYNSTGSTRGVRFTTSKTNRYKTSPTHCHIDWMIWDSEWEAQFARTVEAHPGVLAYVKNHNLYFEVPYRSGATARQYRPDFIVRLDDGRGPDDPLNLIVEIKGCRGENAKDKADTMRRYWVPGVNNLGGHGRWAFAEFTDVHEIAAGFRKLVETLCEKQAA